MVQRAFRVALDLDELTILDVHECAAPAMAAAADTLQNLCVLRAAGSFQRRAHAHFPIH